MTEDCSRDGVTHQPRRGEKPSTPPRPPPHPSVDDRPEGPAEAVSAAAARHIGFGGFRSEDTATTRGSASDQQPAVLACREAEGRSDVSGLGGVRETMEPEAQVQADAQQGAAGRRVKRWTPCPVQRSFGRLRGAQCVRDSRLAESSAIDWLGYREGAK